MDVVTKIIHLKTDGLAVFITHAKSSLVDFNTKTLDSKTETMTITVGEIVKSISISKLTTSVANPNTYINTYVKNLTKITISTKEIAFIADIED